MTSLENVKPMEELSVSEETIDLSKVLCTRGNRRTLEIDELKIPKKSIVAIIGENGAGKSTFAEVLTGRLNAKGEILSNGKKLNSKERTKKSYMVMQDVNRQLFCETVKKEILLGCSQENLHVIDTLMETMGIAKFQEEHPASLSGEQKQGVAICAAICAGKDFMIYDEPTSGLDGKSMNTLCELILSNTDRHELTMIITHDLELVMGCCTHVLHLSKGQVLDFYSINANAMPKLKDFFIMP